MLFICREKGYRRHYTVVHHCDNLKVYVNSIEYLPCVVNDRVSEFEMARSVVKELKRRIRLWVF